MYGLFVLLMIPSLINWLHWAANGPAPRRLLYYAIATSLLLIFANRLEISPLIPVLGIVICVAGLILNRRDKKLKA
jgi:hypothetical protein